MRRIALLAALCLRATALKKVLVTGAGGRTGKLVFSQLQQDPEFKAVGLARSPKAVKALEKAGAAAEEIVQADTLDEAALAEAMAGCEGVVLCTSATPQIKKLSLLKALATKAIPFLKPARPAFRFPANGTPEEVDWIGAKKQIDAAKAAGVAHFVLVSSMGGTQPDNFLNSIGRRADGSGGDILLWKRKAERYLIESGLTYTVVHPGGLVDEPGGARELTVGIDDELLGQKSRSVARADVARVCVAALFNEKAENLAFDLASKPAGEGTATADAAAVFDQLTPGAYSYATVLEDPPSVL